MEQKSIKTVQMKLLHYKNNMNQKTALNTEKQEASKTLQYKHYEYYIHEELVIKID